MKIFVLLGHPELDHDPSDFRSSLGKSIEFNKREQNIYNQYLSLNLIQYTRAIQILLVSSTQIRDCG